MTITYVAHGEVDIIIDDDIMMITAEGPWNDEFFPAFHQQLVKAAYHLNIDRYVVLLDVVGQAIATPRSIEYHAKFVSQSDVQAVAISLQHCQSIAVTRPMFHDIYQQAGINHQFFDNKQAAKAWLHKVLRQTK